MERRWDDNIGKLIVFVVTITISLWVFTTLSFFYKKYLDNKRYIAILSDKDSKLQNLNAIWLCKSSDDSTISYNAIFDKYTLKCSDDLWKIYKILLLLKYFQVV